MLAGRTPDGGTRDPPPAWDVADAMDEGWAVEALRAAVEQNVRLWSPPTSQTQWPDEFEITQNGLAKLIKKEDHIERHLFTGPFTVIGEGRDRSGAGRGFWITWQD